MNSSLWVVILWVFAAAAAFAQQSIVLPRDQINDFDARLTLAQALAIFDQHKALIEYNKLLNLQPENKKILKERAEILVRLGYIDAANQEIDRLLEKYPRDTELLEFSGILNAWCGNIKKARKAFQSAMQYGGKAEENYARWRVSWGDFRGAEQFWKQALPSRRIELANVLSDAQEYERAEEQYRIFLKEHPNSVQAHVGLANILYRKKNFPAAIQTAEAILQIYQMQPDALRILAEASLRLKNWPQAEAAFKKLSQQSGHEIEGQIGLGKTMFLQGDSAQAKQQLAAVLRRKPSNTAAQFYLAIADKKALTKPFLDQVIHRAKSAAQLTSWGDLYAQEGYASEALACYQAAIAQNADYFPAQIAEAEILGAMQHYDEAINRWQALARDYPESLKIQLSLARVLGWSKRYKESLAAYESLSQSAPNAIVPARERARVAAWSKNMRLASQLNATLINSSADFLTDPVVRSQLQKTVEIENQAKWLAWNRRFLTSEDQYEELLDFDPGNEEALFDLSQAQAAQGLYGRSIKVYKHLLTIDPLHRRAAEALRRQQILLRPAGFSAFDFWNEEGAGRNAAITRYQIRGGGEYNWKSQYQFRVSNNYWLEMPQQALGPTPAWGWTAEASAIFNEFWSAGLSWTHKIYTRYNLGFTDSGYLNLSFNAWDFARLTLNYARVDEIHNGYALAQKIQSDNFILQVDVQPIRWAEISTAAVFQNYSDDNQGVWMWVEPKIQLFDHPHTLSLGLRFDYRSIQYQTRDILNQKGQTIDIVHPYWTPYEYVRGQAFLEWRHDLSREHYIGSEMRYYSLTVWGGTDSTNNPNITIEAKIHWEFLDRWTFEVNSAIERSQQWNGASAYARLTFRF